MWSVVQFYIFQYVSSSTVSVAVCIPSSASTSQVGFRFIKASPIREERFLSQGHRQSMEVPCSRVFLGSLARFELAVGSGRSTPWSEIKKN